MKYVYFVSFSFTKFAQSGFGNSEIKIDGPIVGLAQVTEMQNSLIAANGFHSVTILGFQLLRRE